MLRTLAYATLFSTALIGSHAYGADNAAAPKDQPPQAQAPSAVNFVTRQGKTQWRAPKLVGVRVYGPDDRQIGKIDDLVMDHNGAAQTVVIGVGGFLGFGKKEVRSAVRRDAMAHGKPEGPGDRSAAGQPRGFNHGDRRATIADEADGPGGYRSEPGLS